MTRTCLAWCKEMIRPKWRLLNGSELHTAFARGWPKVMTSNWGVRRGICKYQDYYQYLQNRFPTFQRCKTFHARIEHVKHPSPPPPWAAVIVAKGPQPLELMDLQFSTFMMDTWCVSFSLIDLCTKLQFRRNFSQSSTSDFNISNVAEQPGNRFIWIIMVNNDIFILRYESYTGLHCGAYAQNWAQPTCAQPIRRLLSGSHFEFLQWIVLERSRNYNLAIITSSSSQAATGSYQEQYLQILLIKHALHPSSSITIPQCTNICRKTFLQWPSSCGKHP